MSKLYVQHDYAIKGKDYVETDGGDTPAGGVDYSTEEQDTGLKWVDGSKIYQTTYELENIRSSTSVFSLGITIGNIPDFSTLIDGFVIGHDSSDSDQCSIGINLIVENGTLKCVSPYNGWSMDYLTIRYTKSE